MTTRRGASRGVLVAWALFLAVVAAPLAQAHKPSDSYLTLTVQGADVSVRWDVALRDLDSELGLDVNDDGALSWGEVRTRTTDIAAFVAPQLTVSSKGVPCVATVSVRSLDPDSIHATANESRSNVSSASTTNDASGLSLASHSDGTYAVLRYQLHCSDAPTVLGVEYHLFAASDPTHRGIVRVMGLDSQSHVAPGASLAVLGPGNPHHDFALTGSSRAAELLSFIDEGVWHIWLGFDHVLFLLTLLLPSVLLAANARLSAPQGLRATLLDVLKIVTAFTIAHSLTLSLAVLDWVNLPSRLVESGIALTVLLGALNNLLPVLRERRWMAAFAFGLIHGFGFAGALKSLQLQPGELALSLFGFNVGVELGQLAIVTAFVPLAFAVRDTRFYRHGVVRGGSVAIALIAVGWLIERVWDVRLFTP